MKAQLTLIPEFLSTVRSALRPGSGASLGWVVLGNESADLDSAVSSLLYAFSLFTSQKQLAAPILPIPRADILLRTEITYFLSLLGVDPHRDLFFSDDLDRIYSSIASDSACKPKLALADFNSLPPSLAHLAPHVAAIVDHHVDSGAFPTANPRVIEPVGSATSLIVRDCFTPAALDANTKAEVARLALGPILLDTINLNRAMLRATDVDAEAAAVCLSWLPESTLDTSALYAAMLKAKADISHLSSADLLRKDYKEFELREGGGKYGMASVMWDLHKWIERDGGAGVLDQALGYARERGLHSLYILTAFEDQEGGFHRQLAVVSGDRGREQAVVEVLMTKEETSGLQVKEAAGQVHGQGQLVVYDVGKHVSRKVLQPLLHRVLVDL
ncbi:hypothetical protein BCR44DRAFT_42993 [Catenaria anguillulae PL171]|uniref:DHHA2 domain-containing protein n=1 Tax=Catenaria anguillulae PL171 TaxID=765915 RepID=A0A1Y2I615_9FUNG|nr:hypothetical protein BCR44DRAFT_42993 [Catenaria anguillulae PL171]